MNPDPLVEEVYRNAFVEVLFERASEVLCPKCSEILESQALSRYKMMMGQRRKEISNLQIKAEKERQRDARRRELQRQNKDNNHEQE